MKRLIFGCGYLGQRVARRWRQQGDEVFAVTRSASRAAELELLGLHAVVADVTVPASLSNLAYADTVLYAVGHDRSAVPSIESVFAGGLRHVLSAIARDTRSFIYISTTGVYGDASGKWVDESSPPAPEREGGRASLAAEHVLGQSPLAPRSVILRLAGLYGPQRIPFLNKLRAGDPIPAAVHGWLNLIHVEDAAAAVIAADLVRARPLSGGPIVLNVSDGQPVQRLDYYREVARLIGAPPPRFGPPDPASHRAQRAATNRRISNAALLRELNLELAYPSFRDGLCATLIDSCLESEPAENHPRS
jgi:nucleoside-diphosphate-sugar epimerase